jgi:hypothetical protein
MGAPEDQCRSTSYEDALPETSMVARIARRR